MAQRTPIIAPSLLCADFAEIQLALDQINKNGGIRNKRLTALFLDDKNDKLAAAPPTAA